MEPQSNQDWHDRPARERILLTAHDLFYSDGIRATGIDKIIAESTVTKVTFYRHFPSKNDLILAFLEFRHEIWMSWFKDALQRHGGKLGALEKAMEEWFGRPDFRGCAFLNSVSELGGVLPQIHDITRRHKDDVVAVVEGLLPASPERHLDATAICIVLDGAIARATFDRSSETARLAMSRAILAITSTLVSACVEARMFAAVRV